MDESMYETIFAPLTIGDEVPEDFEFEVYHENKISELSFGELRGKWVVLFFSLFHAFLKK